MIPKKPAATHSTRRDPDTGRIKVYNENTAFYEGTEYRISYPLTVPLATPVVLRFESPIDFILQLQQLTSDTQGIRFRAYRSTQGTQGGTFGTVVPVYKLNFMSDVPNIPNQALITTGGTFTPSGGQTAVETIRIKTSGQTNQQATVSGSIGDERGLAAGIYFLVFDSLGNGTAEGVFNLVWEERP